MNNLVSQSAFARLKSVSRKTVSEWNVDKKLVFVGRLVDVEATQARMLTYASHRAKGQRQPVTLTSPEVTGDSPRYADGVTYDNPANLPDEVCSTSSMIGGGADDMARLIRPHLSLAITRALVSAWVEVMRDGIVGGPDMPESVADDGWPEPPIGLTHWREHSYFQGDAITAYEWVEIEADYADGKLTKVGASS